MDKGHLLPTGLARLMGVGHAVNQHIASISAMDAAKRFDKRRFASAVFTKQGHNLTARHAQRHAAQGLRAAKGLGDLVKKQAVGGRLHGGRLLPSGCSLILRQVYR